MTPLMTFIPFADKNNEKVFRLEKKHFIQICYLRYVILHTKYTKRYGNQDQICWLGRYQCTEYSNEMMKDSG